MTTDSEAIVVEADLDAPPGTVWRALTEPELLAAWLEPDAGVTIEVLEAEPCQRLRLGWRGPDGARDAAGLALDTEVTFTLVPTEAGGTRLTVVHAGFAARPMTLATAEVIALPAAGPGRGEPTMMGELRWAA